MKAVLGDFAPASLPVDRLHQGFGGPVALVGYMYRDLVERRGWISESDYEEGMALAQLMPGPLAAQLSIYLGYVHFRVLGATLVGLAFVLLSFVMVAAIGAVYTAYGGISWMQAVFYGVGAAVIGIIAMSAYKLTMKNIGKENFAVVDGELGFAQVEGVLRGTGEDRLGWDIGAQDHAALADCI